MRLYVFIASSIVFLAACNNKKVPQPTKNTPTETTTETQLPEPYGEVKIKKDKVQFPAIFIGANDTWFTALISGGDRNTAMVNASNEQTTFGGGGINGAMAAYFTFKGANSWGQLYNPSGIAHTGEVRPGHFVYSQHAAPIAFNFQLHAVGPQKSAYVDNFAAARDLVKDLTFDMLEWAQAKNIDNIVIPAISTEIFAGNDENYKKEMYNGMADGVFKFIEKHGNETLPKIIYLNLWGKKNNPGRERLEKQIK